MLYNEQRNGVHWIVCALLILAVAPLPAFAIGNDWTIERWSNADTTAADLLPYRVPALVIATANDPEYLTRVTGLRLSAELQAGIEESALFPDDWERTHQLLEQDLGVNALAALLDHIQVWGGSAYFGPGSPTSWAEYAVVMPDGGDGVVASGYLLEAGTDHGIRIEQSSTVTVFDQTRCAASGQHVVSSGGGFGVAVGGETTSSGVRSASKRDNSEWVIAGVGSRIVLHSLDGASETNIETENRTPCVPFVAFD